MIEKEVRALLPAWTMGAVAVIASRYQIPSIGHLGLPVYLIVAAGLGGWSVGHEYAYGTMASMLTLPVPRGRWWTAKLAVLAPALAALAALASHFVVVDHGDQAFIPALFWLTALAALCVAPWLTLLARSSLAGAVFTLGIVGMSIALGDWIGVHRYGYTRDVEEFRRAFLGWTLGGLSLVGAAAGWSTFARLQDAGGLGRDLQLFARPAAAASMARLHRRRPLVALFLKEVRLQQLAILVAAVYTAGSLAVLYVGRVVPGLYGVFEVLIALYILSVPALIGSLACAEERQFGTLDGQLLLPITTARQWLVKSATAIGLAIVMALLLPSWLSRLLPPGAIQLGPTGSMVTAQTVTLVVACVSVSLFVSTLARSGMAALISSTAAIAAAGYFYAQVASRFGYKAFELVHRARPAHAHHTLMFGPGVYFTVETFAVLLVAIVAMALPHYRYIDRRRGLVAFHIALAAVGLVAYSVAMNVSIALRY